MAARPRTLVPLVGAVLMLCWSSPASAKARRSKSKPAARPPPSEEDADAPPTNGQGLLLSAALGAGSAPGGALVLLAGAAAYRLPWEDRFIDLHGSYAGGLSGGSLDHLLLVGARLGGARGTTGLSGWVGTGYRLAALAMPYGPSHVYSAWALEGALELDPWPEMRLEVGLELDYPASGPDGASLVIGVGAHALALWRFGEAALFARYDALDFHARLGAAGLDDFTHALSLGVRSALW